MKMVPIILGYHVKCYWCGKPTRLVHIPAIGDQRWTHCEDFEGVPEYIELHDCPKHPRNQPETEPETGTV